MTMVSARVVDTRKDRKYSLIKPLWFDVKVEAEDWVMATSLGTVFSIQIWSRRVVASFWLIRRFILGGRRCIVMGKYPSRVENLVECE